ncbi:MAG: hypothetical protein AB7F96_07940 [Beijerinckiaceae bacterium]
MPDHDQTSVTGATALSASDATIWLVSSEPYIRTVVAQELGDAGLIVRTAGDDLEFLQKLNQSETPSENTVVIFGPPLDSGAGIQRARQLTHAYPGLRVGFFTEHAEYFLVSGLVTGFAILDRSLRLEALATALRAFIEGHVLIITQEMRQQRIDAVLKRMAAAENLGFVRQAFRRKYREVIDEPLPADIEERLDKLK